MVSNSIMDPLVVLGRRGRKRNVNLNPEKREQLDKKNHAAKLKRLQNGQGTGARVKGINSPVKDNCVSDRTKSIRVTNECIKEGKTLSKTYSFASFKISFFLHARTKLVCWQNKSWTKFSLRTKLSFCTTQLM